VAAIFEHRPSLLRWNSPSLVLPRKARTLRSRHVYVWLYTASGDRLRTQNVRFAAELRRLRVPYRFTVLHGGHDWSLWRGRAGDALLAASRHLGGPRA
jgi:enterochelin esterase-like enzyme